MPLSIKVISWNVEGSKPPTNLRPLLGLNDDELPDLFAIGIQGVKSDPVDIVIDAFYDDPWTNAINSVLSKRRFKKIATKRQGGTHLSIYVKELTSTITSVQSDVIGFGELSDNEGAVVITLGTENGAILQFANVHLRQNAMNEDFCLLQKYLKIADSNLNEEKSTFCFGDFGSCLSDPELTDEVVQSLIESRDFEQLLLGDQLKVDQANQEAFQDFREKEITFAPSFDAGHGTRPAWRDRVLWRDNSKVEKLQQVEYKPLPIDGSRHKPVIATFVLSYHASSCTFIIPSKWDAKKDGSFEFRVPSTFVIASGDWVGLFPFSFGALESLTYVWASSLRRIEDASGGVVYEGSFREKCLKGLERDKHYVLAYIHNKRYVVVKSEGFQLLSEGETVSKYWFGFFEARMNETKEDDGMSIRVKVPSLLDGIYIRMLQSENCSEKLDSALRKCFSDFRPIIRFDSFASSSYFDGNDTACIACLPDAFDEVLNHYQHNQKVFVNISGAYNDRSICSLREIFNAFTSFRTNIEQKSLYQVIFSYEEEKCFITFQIPKMLREFQKGNEELNLTLNEMSDLNRWPRYNTKSLSNFKRSFQTRGLMIEDGWLEVFSPFGLPTNPPLIVAFYSSKDLYSDGSFNWSLSFLVMLATVLGGVLVTIDCVCVRPSGRNINLLAGLAFAQEFRSLIEVYVPRKCKIYFVGVGEGAFLATEVLSAANALNSGPAIDLVIIDPTCYFRPPLSNPGEEARVLMVLLERNQPDPNATSNPLSLNFATDLAAVSNVICDVFTSEKEDWINSRLRFYGNAVGLIGAYIDSNFLRPAGQ